MDAPSVHWRVECQVEMENMPSHPTEPKEKKGTRRKSISIMDVWPHSSLYEPSWCSFSVSQTGGGPTKQMKFRTKERKRDGKTDITVGRSPQQAPAAAASNPNTQKILSQFSVELHQFMWDIFSMLFPSLVCIEAHFTLEWKAKTFFLIRKLKMLFCLPFGHRGKYWNRENYLDIISRPQYRDDRDFNFLYCLQSA